nr:TIGR03905 family TSCPD domain-containing protein [Clostridiales bacterium]
DGKLSNVVFTGGCNGNLKAIGRLVEGKDAREIADLLRGNLCGFKNTSCADQLSKAIDRALEA